MLVETITWTPKTLKTELRRKRYGLNKVQGLDCEELSSRGLFTRNQGPKGLEKLRRSRA
jgi:hypothetical protein